MKRFVVLMLVLAMTFSVGGVLLAKKGPIVDTIFFDVRMKEEIGLMDTVAGKTDVFMQGLNGPQVWALSDEDLAKLDVYQIPSGSWSLLLNPYPNEAPYTGVVDGKEEFNPFAIREIRFALNFLINRQYIVDEILGGAGGAMFTPATPGQPGVYKYNLIASKLGLTPEGDEDKAIADITAAMEKAAALPELKGRLVKEGQWWMFDGEPVELRFALRADDPNGRVKEGMYVANQVEKAGIKVDRMVLAREKCYKLAYYGDPAELGWHLYTEGWGAGATRRYWGVSIVQMYASVWGYLPGGGEPDFWNFKNEELDEIATTAYNGEVLTEEEYWDGLLTATEMGMKDAVRLQVVYQDDFFVANKARFNKRMAYGLGDGLNDWSLISADTKGGVLRVTLYSDKGSLFMSNWDPVGADGFSDVYSLNIAQLLADPSTFESPVSAVDVPKKVKLIDWEYGLHRDEKGEIVGEIEVDPRAMEYDAIKGEWVKVKPGEKFWVKSEYEFIYSNFHHGIKESMLDFLYAEGFREEWKTENYPGDPQFDAKYQSYFDSVEQEGATVYDLEADRVIAFYNYNFPADLNRMALNGAPGYRVFASSNNVRNSFEITEALARMVAYGAESGTVWAFNQSKQGAEEVDVLTEKCVTDIRAELVKMVDEKHVPVYIKDFTTFEELKPRYEAAINFIDQYGHAYISNGPFMLEKFDKRVNYAKLTAFRDDTYPYEAGHWYEQFKTPRFVINNVEVPVMAAKGQEFQVKVDLSEIVYPEIDANPADKATVVISLVTDEKNIDFTAEMIQPGVYAATISGEATKALEAGSYTILVAANGEGAVPASASQMTIIY